MTKLELDNFIEECKHTTHCKEYERPKEIKSIIDNLVDFDSYFFYQDNLGKLITYVEELESLIKAIACVVVKPEYRYLKRGIDMNDKKYGLYKRIMKRDQKAIDEIKSLEEAKEIIKMIAGNVYLHSEVYNLQQITNKCPQDCLSCANSFSESSNNGDILHCMERDGEIVCETDWCAKWN